jgi:type I restriction enzyme R subunit
MTHEPWSEADARRELIDHRLRLAGWNVDDPSQVSQELDIYLDGANVGAVRERAREEYKGHQFADYALQLTGRPAAAVV